MAEVIELIEEEEEYDDEGIQERTYIAALAMQGILMNSFADYSVEYVAESVSEMAVLIADEMMRQLYVEEEEDGEIEH